MNPHIPRWSVAVGNTATPPRRYGDPMTTLLRLALMSLLILSACGTDESSESAPTGPTEPTEPTLTCVNEPEAEPDFLNSIGCPDDFAALASEPLNASIPGARSLKTVIDRLDGDKLYFQNSKRYMIHWEFASEHLSGQGLPPVPPLAQFNEKEYYSPSRRFLLGAITFYEDPGVWVYEISPYDTASAEMIQTAYDVISENAFFGPDLYFHPTSQAVETEATNLAEDVAQITTDELFAGISYQPLNLGTSTGKLRFLQAEGLASESLNYRDIVVLDSVPNDIGVVSGIITAELQTTLSHINVLSQNRGTPNMAFLGAHEDEGLLALEGKWVELTVGAFEWSIREVTKEEADQWWDENKPKAVGVPNLDVETLDIVDIEDLLDFETPPEIGKQANKEQMEAALDKAIPAYGGKASHYAGFAYMDPELVPVPRAWAIPVGHYVQHMKDNGLDVMVSEMLADSSFQGDSAVRAAKLEELQQAIRDAPIDPELKAEVHLKMQTDFPGQSVRFRSSTNAEDLDGFTGAGLYTSKSGDLADPSKRPEDAIKHVWASVWNYKAFDEREYRSIDHEAVGMALLCHRSFPNEAANGVALTANIFDTSGLEPGFYINVQKGGASVVLPEAGVTTDQIIYHYFQPGQPAIFLSHSNLVNGSETVLTPTQLYRLGQALEHIHMFWMDTYGPALGNPTEFYAMDVEFKFDSVNGGAPELFVKQARPHPGWGL